jgi:hypothetical protein
MAFGDFFTIFKHYFRCCCFTTEVDHHKEGRSNHTGIGNRGNRGGIGSGSGSGSENDSNSPFSFDDLSNPLTPMTGSSSSSSLEDYRIYQRPKFKPYVGIIPANYYSD